MVPPWFDSAPFFFSFFFSFFFLYFCHHQGECTSLSPSGLSFSCFRFVLICFYYGTLLSSSHAPMISRGGFQNPFFAIFCIGQTAPRSDLSSCIGPVLRHHPNKHASYDRHLKRLTRKALDGPIGSGHLLGTDGSDIKMFPGGSSVSEPSTEA